MQNPPLPLAMLPYQEIIISPTFNQAYLESHIKPAGQSPLALGVH